jgi:hypothetical protein
MAIANVHICEQSYSAQGDYQTCVNGYASSRRPEVENGHLICEGQGPGRTT